MASGQLGTLITAEPPPAHQPCLGLVLPGGGQAVCRGPRSAGLALCPSPLQPAPAPSSGMSPGHAACPHGVASASRPPTEHSTAVFHELWRGRDQGSPPLSRGEPRGPTPKVGAQGAGLQGRCSVLESGAPGTRAAICISQPRVKSGDGRACAKPGCPLLPPLARRKQTCFSLLPLP